MVSRETLGVLPLILAARVRRLVPDPWLDPLSRAVAPVSWPFLGRRKRAIIENLRHLLPAADARELRRACHATVAHFVRCNADLLAFPFASPESIRGLFDVAGRAHLDEALALGRPVVMVGGHVGHFELCGVGAAALGYNVTVFAEAVNPARDAVFSRLRMARGLEVLSPGAGVRSAFAALAAGRILGIAGDRVWPGQARLRVPFGDACREVPTGPARIAIRAGAAVFTCHAVRTPGGARPYRLTIEPEVPQGDLGGEPADELTRRIAARLSGTAERYPDQWFVFTPQWIGASSRP